MICAPIVTILENGKRIHIEFPPSIGADVEANSSHHKSLRKKHESHPHNAPHEYTFHATWLYSNSPSNLHVPSGQRKLSPGQLSRGVGCIIQDAEIVTLDSCLPKDPSADEDPNHVEVELNADEKGDSDKEVNDISYLANVPYRSVHSRDFSTTSPSSLIKQEKLQDRNHNLIQTPIWILRLDWKAQSSESKDNTKPTNTKSYFNVEWLRQWSYDDESLKRQRRDREVTPTHTFMEQPFTHSTCTRDLLDTIVTNGSPSIRRCKEFLGLQHFESDRIGLDGTDHDNEKGSLLPLFDAIFTDGAAIVTGIPSPATNEENDYGYAVTKMAKSLAGSLSHTNLYGDVFHVKSVPQANNVAYTSHSLCPHQDLIYYESKPGLQFLHCIANSEKNIEGGNSVLIDAMAAAYRFRELAPKMFETLVKCPATFVKEREGAKMTYVQPHIVLKEGGKEGDIDREIVSVNWAPPFEGPLHLPFDQIEAYYNAYSAFEVMLDSSIKMESALVGDDTERELFMQLMEYARTHTWEYRLKPGEMIIFNNTRMLHGRQSFRMLDPSLPDGGRHLVGGYANIDDTLNTYRNILKEKGSKTTILNVGNGSILL